MARKFGKIEGGFWQNHKVRRLSDDAQKLLMYLFTCKHSNGASAYELTMGYVTDDLIWTGERATKAFHELALKPFALRDTVNNIVFIPGWWDHNPPENPKVAIFLARNLLSLPDCQMKADAIEGLKKSGQRREAVLQAIGDWSYEPKQEGLALALDTGQRSLLPAEPAPAPAKKAERSTGTRLSPDWRAPAEYRDYASSKGLSQDRIDYIETRFVRYWTSPDAKEPVKKDWLRTWKNWIDDESQRRSSNGHHAKESVENVITQESDLQWELREKGFKEKGTWLASWGDKPGEPNYRGKRKPVPPPV